jgi:hypothetical protein
MSGEDIFVLIVKGNMTMERYSKSKKRGCPTCNGVDPKSCMRCHGKTRLCDWSLTKNGWENTVMAAVRGGE